jgi:hypothetical protein
MLSISTKVFHGFVKSLVKNPDDGWVNPEKITLGRMYVAFEKKKKGEYLGAR